MSDDQDVVFRALADRHRRKILATLSDGPQVAGELARKLELAPNALSFHLKWLKAAGLISSRRDGRYLHYHANPDALHEWREHVRAFLRPSSDLAAVEPETPGPFHRPDESFPSRDWESSVEPPDDQLPTELL